MIDQHAQQSSRLRSLVCPLVGMDVLDRMGQQLLPAGCSCFRQLQSTGAEDSAATIDANSIAIIISVAVGMIGYMIQAWSARRADEAAAQLQRRQEMTNAQIVRTSQWIDLCCRPALLGLSEYMTARLRTVVGVAHLVEASQPDEYHRLFGELRVMGPVSEMPDGSTVWSASGKATFELPDRQAVTLATSTHALADFCIGCSKTTHMVSLHDSFNVQVHSHAAELPMGKGCRFLVFVPIVREIRDFYREM
eukprot:SAG31_NODE_2316_length_5951_cov_7.632262_3_plen_250_part_00